MAKFVVDGFLSLDSGRHIVPPRKLGAAAAAKCGIKEE